MRCSRSVSSSVSNASQRVDDRQVDVVRDAGVPSRARPGSPASADRRRRRGTAAARDTARAPPDRSRSRRRTGAADSESRLRNPRRRDPCRAACGASTADSPWRFRRRPRPASLGRVRRRAGAPNSTMSRCFFGSLPNGTCGSMPNVRCSPSSISAIRRRSPFAHGAIAPPRERLRVVRHDAAGIEIVDRAEALAVRARAVRRVERKRARRHLGNADAADRTGHAPREQPIAAVERVDDDDVVGELEREVDRIATAAARCRSSRSADRPARRSCGSGGDRA